MFYFGKHKESGEWCFALEDTVLQSSIEVSDEDRENLIEQAQKQGKLIGGDKDGNPILVDPPPPSEKEQKQQRLNELLSYLEETDWYAIRFADTGEPIPEEIKKRRQDARDEISKLKENS